METKDGRERVYVHTYRTPGGKVVPAHYRTPPCLPAKPITKKGK